MNTFCAPLVAGAIFAATNCALAQDPVTDAYSLDTNARVIKNPYGLCWRTSQWSPAKALAECDPDLVPKPAAPQPAPPPPVIVAPVAPVDTDGDGVTDAMDRCPGTPRGARVDDQGCELDSDNDGVVDRLDKCPGTVAGAKVDARGCEIDSDRDGVVDRLDKCPGTVAGAKVDAQGCELDADRDGVVDRLDQCPGSRAGAKVDERGCERVEVTVLKGVTFATNSATLTRESMAVLDETAATLANNPALKAEVAGHTDNSGSAARNRVLSQQRAESVVRYLVSKGVSKASLTARGYGPDQPVANNRTAQGRSANRRVELRTFNN
jgi:OOP family OmpA-OmpF porin